MGTTRAEPRRRRAVGTRDRVMSHLASVGEINDETGMASAVLAREVGYPGSSIAFAQLLSGMERSGLIEREIRGKRTFRITAADGAAGSGDTAADARAGTGDARTGTPGGRAGAAGTQAGAAGTQAGTVGTRAGTVGTRTGTVGARAGVAGGRAGTGAGRGAEPGAVAAVLAAGVVGKAAGVAGEAAGPGDFDYDELARRLLVQVVRRLGATPTGPAAAADYAALTTLEQATLEQATLEQAALAETVAGLEQELASARTMHGTLTEENAQLREQLRAARRSLALAQERSADQQVADQLDPAEVRLLDRLLSRSAEDARGEDTG